MNSNAELWYFLCVCVFVGGWGVTLLPVISEATTLVTSEYDRDITWVHRIKYHLIDPITQFRQTCPLIINHASYTMYKPLIKPL